MEKREIPHFSPATKENALSGCRKWAEIIVHTCSADATARSSFSAQTTFYERMPSRENVLLSLSSSSSSHRSANISVYFYALHNVDLFAVDMRRWRIIDTEIIKGGLYSFEDWSNLIKSWHKRLKKAANLCEFYGGSRVERFDCATKIMWTTLHSQFLRCCVECDKRLWRRFFKEDIVPLKA